MSIKNNSLAKNTAWGASASLIATICRMGTGIALARTFSTEINGSYLLFSWFSEFVSLIVCMGAPAVLTRYLAVEQQNNKKEKVASILFWAWKRSSISLIIVMPFLFFILKSIDATSHFKDSTLLLVLLVLFSQVFSIVGSSCLIGLQRFKKLASNNLATGVSTVVLQISGAYLYGLNGALIGLVISNIIGSILALYSIWSYFDFNEKTEVDNGLKIFASESGISAILSAVVWARCELFFLNQYSNASNAAFFGVSISLVSAINLGVTMLTTALTPHFSSRMAPNLPRCLLQRDFTLLTLLTGFICIPAAIYSAALMPTMLPFLFGTKYVSAVLTAQILIVSAGLGFANVSTSLHYASGNSKYILYSNIIGAMLMILCLFLVIKDYGSVGAACSRLFVQCSIIFMGIKFTTNRLKIKFPVYSLIKLIVLCALFSAPIYILQQYGFLLALIYMFLSIFVVLFILKKINYLGRSEAIRVFFVIDKFFKKKNKSNNWLRKMVLN